MRTFPLRVLLADDVARIRSLLRQLLEDDGRFTVVGEAADGMEAVALATEEQPDVVMLDVAMPVLDGLSAPFSELATSPAEACLSRSGEEAGSVGLGLGARDV